MAANEMFSSEKQVAIIEGMFDLFEEKQANVFEVYRACSIVMDVMKPKVSELLEDMEGILEELSASLSDLNGSIASVIESE